MAAAAVLSLPLLLARASSLLRSNLAGAARQAAEFEDTLRTSAVALDQAATALAASSTTLLQVRQSLQDSEPLLGSTGRLVGQDVPLTLESTRESLIQAESAARAMDQVLRALDLLGPLTGVAYDPPQTLDRSLAGAAEALLPLPGSLRATAAELEVATAELHAIQTDLERLAREMRSLGASLGNAAERLQSEAEQLDGVSEALTGAAERAAWITGAAGALLSLGLVGLALTQAAVFLVGRSLLQSGLAA